MTQTDPEVFLANLERHTLDSTFEKYGNFAVPGDDGTTHFHGNFADLSAVFDFRLSGEEAARVEIAIRRHQRTERYRAADRERRLRVARSWAYQQVDRWGNMTARGGMVLRHAQDGDLARAERIMAEAR